MTPTCRTCRFLLGPSPIELWDDEADDVVETGHHACARIIHGNRTCAGANAVAARKSAACVVDGSGYAARLVVLPDEFGCALWEMRET